MDVIKKFDVNIGSTCCNTEGKCGDSKALCQTKELECHNACNEGANNCLVAISCKVSCA